MRSSTCEREKSELRDRYGRHTFGQDCLVARRLVEAGVPYVVINYPGGWDTHKDHFQTMRRQCPQLDQGLAALAAGPERSRTAGQHAGLVLWRVRTRSESRLATTLERWTQPLWQSLLGIGRRWRVPGGQVVGSSTEKGEEVQDRPVYPVDLLGSIYQLAGIDAQARLPHPLGLEARVLPTAEEGAKSAGRLTEIM